MGSSGRLAWFVILMVIIADQLLKVYIKTSFVHGEEHAIMGLSWAFLRFEENEGMAFNWRIGGQYGKLILTCLRISAMLVLAYFLKQALADKANRLTILGFSLVLAGAIGNIIDSVFYGVLFSESIVDGDVAQFWPPEGGYAPLLLGSVVDMFYFPVWVGEYPEWVPFLGGKVYHFFRPVFNIADVAIFSGVVLLIKEFLFRKPEELTEIATTSEEE